MVRNHLITADRVVIKIGSRVLLEENGRPNYNKLAHLVEQIASLHKKNRKIIFVTSGAIGAGMEALGIKKRPSDLPTLQAAAAIGQVRLMRIYEDLFGEFGCMVAQVLLTRDDVNDRNRHLSIKNTFNALLDRGVIPIVNENDTVAVEEIKFGDNDVLASLVAMMLEAKALVLLTTAEGFMITNEQGTQERLGHIYKIDEEILRHIEAHKIGLSSGGMKSKLIAAANMIHVGGVAVIASGNATNALNQIFAGENIGTTVGLHHEKISPTMPGKKRWIAFYQRAKGHVSVDDGAKLAIMKQGKSLLAVGIYEVSGKFHCGDVVEIHDKNGVCFAKGVSQFDSADINSAMGQKVKEVIHRDSMAILRGEHSE